MLTKRIIPCLDVRDGKTTKGIRFKNNVDIGDPVEMARFYYEEGADELVFLDITASHENRNTMLDMVRRVADTIFIPFCVGGGIRTTEDIRATLRAGADKISINSAGGRTMVCNCARMGFHSCRNRSNVARWACHASSFFWYSSQHSAATPPEGSSASNAR